MASVVKREFFGASPRGVRGFSILMDSSPTHFAYCSTDHIVLRAFEKPHQCEVYRGHQQPTAVRFCPCAPLVCSGDANGVIKVWGLENPSLTRLESKLFAGKVRDIAWSPDGQRLLVCGEGKKVHATIIMAEGGALVSNIEGFTQPVISCDWRPTRPWKFVLSSDDRQVGFYTVGDTIKQEWQREEMDVLTRQTRFSPSGKYFILVGMGKIVIYDADSGERAFELPSEHRGTVCGVCWSSDSDMILTASCDQTVKLWDINEASVAQTFRFSDKKDVKLQQLGVAWGVASMISADLSGNLNMLDFMQPEANRIIPGLSTEVQAMAVDVVTGVVWAGATCDRECKVVGYRTAPSPDQLYGDNVGAISTVTGKGPSVGITGLSVRDGLMAVLSMDGKISMADVTDPFTAHYVHQADGVEVPSKGCIMAANGVVYLATNTHLSIRNYGDGLQQAASVSVKYTPLAMALSPDETELAVSADLGRRGANLGIHLYAVTPSSIEQVGRINGTIYPTRALAYSPDAQMLAAGDDNREVRFYNRSTDWTPELEDYSFHGQRVTSLCWSAAGDRCVSVGLDRGVVVHPVANLKAAAVFEKISASPIAHVEFMNEGLFVTAGTDGTISSFEFK